LPYKLENNWNSWFSRFGHGNAGFFLFDNLIGLDVDGLLPGVICSGFLSHWGQDASDFHSQGVSMLRCIQLNWPHFPGFCLGRMWWDWFGIGFDSGERFSVSVGSDMGGVLWWVFRWSGFVVGWETGDGVEGVRMFRCIKLTMDS